MKSNYDNFDINKKWEYENGFYITSPVSRIAKVIAQYELYKRTINLPGHIVECGVYKGSSLIRLATYREMIENQFSRKIIGFDAFGKFPMQNRENDNKFIEDFENMGGDGLSCSELNKIFEYKGFKNFELVQGDIIETVPEYVKANPELKISILHIDVDVYEPTKVILRHLFDHVVSGGVIMFDDYGTVEGETKAIDEFFKEKECIIEKLPIAHIPSFMIKK